MRYTVYYYEVELVVFYNDLKDYEPATGRYLQSDPIGLDGGLNTYGYVEAISLI
ncbi:MAG: hypothetical protein EOO69_02385 [Moraxellaceae bacterium]|nr:MAG: hypothetical protein EOO69_02385 [Moraxellaceae bacterium]